MRSVLSLPLLLMLAANFVGAQTPTQQKIDPNKTSNEAMFPCDAEPAYEAMLADPQWKNANALYQILLAVKPRSQATPNQRENIRLLLTAMGNGVRKPDPDLVQTIADDFVQGASLRKITNKQKAGLAVNMQFAMEGLNADYDAYMSNVNTGLAFIAGTFNGAGMSQRKSHKIADDVYALIAKARTPK